MCFHSISVLGIIHENSIDVYARFLVYIKFKIFPKIDIKIYRSVRYYVHLCLKILFTTTVDMNYSFRTNQIRPINKITVPGLRVLPLIYSAFYLISLCSFDKLAISSFSVLVNFLPLFHALRFFTKRPLFFFFLGIMSTSAE